MAEVIKYTTFRTKWGYFGIAGTDKGLVRTQLPIRDQHKLKSFLLKGLKAVVYEKDFHISFQKQITAYFNGYYINFDSHMPVILDSLSLFSQVVLKASRDIRYGKTRSYGEIAKRIGRPKAARAVGRAIASNPLPLIIPCHRVTYNDGRIGGFSSLGGVEMKKKLLALEECVLNSKS
ncbi:MAG: methylated-DNA--[protein]-cysteine S-methyltransferase [Sedimentisphaerales bacterium]|nr:methylated-DNA--[protein]-cysteine S-methyltransferase [Sedimentisphaerales bacterium]